MIMETVCVFVSSVWIRFSGIVKGYELTMFLDIHRMRWAADSCSCSFTCSC